MIRKIRNITSITIFLTVLLLASSAFGVTNWFVDTTLATGNNDGTTMDDAWQSIETAMEKSDYDTRENNIWIRRVSSHSSPGSDISVGDSGGSAALNSFIGWPRNSHAISSSDWTSGSTEVTVDDNDMDREKHQGRYITGPDGRTYLITQVIDSDTIIIDRPYIGSNASDQAATIAADEDYATAQTIDDSAWTIKKTNWNADADDIPCIDLGASNYRVLATGKYGVAFKYLEFKDGAGSTTSYATISGSPASIILKGCLIKQTNNARAMYGGEFLIDRCIFEGGGYAAGGTSNHGIYPMGGGSITNSAIYDFRGYAMYASNTVYLQNVNIGVEKYNGTAEIYAMNSYVFGYDVKLGGYSGYVASPSPRTLSMTPTVMIENYQKVLGANQFFYGSAFYAYKLDVVAGSGDPYKRTGGSDSVLALKPANTTYGICNIYDYKVLDICILADTSSKSYRFYVQTKNVPTLTRTELHVSCTYIGAYESTTKYQETTVESDESVTVRSDESDWSQYIEVTGIQPAVASIVHLKIFYNTADTDGYIYIDPLPYIY